jgi:hypothetical protein
MKKAMCVLVTFLLGAALFAGGGSQAAPSTASGGGPMEILYSSSSVPDPDAPVIKRVEEKFNVKFNWFPTSFWASAEQFNLLISSGTIPDTWMDWNHQVWLDQGIIRTVSVDMIKKYMPVYYNDYALVNDPDMIGFARRDVGNGNLMGLPTEATNWVFYRVWRKDYLDNLGLSVPTTLEEMEKVMIAMVNDDPDRNGRKDTWGWLAGGVSDFAEIFGCFGVVGNTWLNQNGKIIYSNVTEGYREGLKVLARWYKLGILDPEYLTKSSDTKRAQFIDGRYASMFNEATNIGDNGPNTFTNQTKAQNPKAEFVAANLVTGPTGLKGTYAYTADFGWTQVFRYDLPDEKVQKIMEILDWALDWREGGGYELVHKGIEGLHFKKENGAYINLMDGDALAKQGVTRTTLNLDNPTIMSLFGSPQLAKDAAFGMSQKTIDDAILKLPLLKSNEAGIPAALTPIYDKYRNDAIMGLIDIDSTWNAYVKQCNDAGLIAQTAEAQELYDTRIKK